MSVFLRRSELWWTALLIAPLLLLAACATSGAGGGEGNTVAIEVRNDIRPLSAVTVRVGSTNGVRQILGTVPPGGTRTLSFNEQALSGQYRLTAETTDGRTIESRPFTLVVAATVRWSLFSNTVSVIQ